ncbi:hypothetical protein OH76DRAFT_150576 [Lentinus brumalis]|uniref:Uncharacterized protein n=1 Tax=Lentinus brumalis TaxID=2498619 RepID=A0A371CP13_9APHY|nr:hypothetical protein OH76DRAFT_150576 [Polyporus brumalis]
MNKVLTDLKKAEWEVKQLEAKQDKTIVEHVHVLEEAKRVTDRQLAEAQVELQKQAAYIRSLEKAKARLTTEAEDLAREKSNEELAIRTKEKKARDQEAKAARALADLENERRAREAAEVYVRRLQNELKDSQAQVAEAEQRMIGIQKAKDNLEIELTRLADETEAPTSFAKLQRQYESKIGQLEQQLEESDLAQSAAARIKEHVDRQHAEIRRLIMSSGPKDDSFRNRLLRELQLADEEMERELTHRTPGRHGNRTGEQLMANVTPTKSRSNGTVRFKDSVTEIPRTPDRHAQVDKLRQQVQVLELQMAASTRIRQYLETSLREMTEELQNSDGSKQSIESWRARLAKENARLAELLEEEAEARRAAQAAQLDGVQAMWDRFQNTIDQERESYTRLEESRKALLVQQRAAQMEVEDQRRHVQELTASKKQLQNEVNSLKERLDAEILAKNDEIAIKRSLQARLQELEITSSATSTIHSELQEAIEAYKSKTDEYLKRYEEAEIKRAKAARAESFARRALADAEKAQAAIVADRQAAEQRLQVAENRVRELEHRLEDEGRESSDLEVLRQRLAEEMEDERKQHQQDIAERDFAADQTRKKYQGPNLRNSAKSCSLNATR